MWRGTAARSAGLARAASAHAMRPAARWSSTFAPARSDSLSSSAIWAVSAAAAVTAIALSAKPVATTTAAATAPKGEDKEFRSTWEATVRGMQRDMCNMLERVDGKGKFREDVWTRPEGGGGWTRVLQDGEVFEKAGVNVSTVHGLLPKAAAAQMKSRGLNLGDKPSPFFACGMSLVIHPKNPFAPTMHANYRYFEVLNEETGQVTWWFGGGADLTPSYLFEEDAVLFHAAHKHALDQHDKSLYPEYKKWCDEYFYLPHRGETRGIGGIFFDDVEEIPNKAPASTTSERARKEAIRAMDLDLVKALVESYETITNRRKSTPFTPEQKRWQQLRRGRYVEFNVGIDRGTRFGMQTPGSRIESILMSLPLTARWEYDVQVDPHSPEGKLQDVLKNPRDWLAHTSDVKVLQDAGFMDLLNEVERRGKAAKAAAPK